MSQYHKHCGTSSTPAKKPARPKKTKVATRVIPKIVVKEEEPENKPTNVVALLTTKAFCDCSYCACRDCPDILKMLSITVSDTTCHFGSKVSDKDHKPETSKPAISALLDVVNPERDCSCGVVARGIRDHVHMNIGMTGRRDKIKAEVETCNAKCKEDCKHKSKGNEGKPTPPKDAKNVITKNNTADNAAPHKCQICNSMARA